MVEMLYNSNIIVYVGTGKCDKMPKNKLFIWDESKQKSIGNLTFNCNILNIKLKNDM